MVEQPIYDTKTPHPNSNRIICLYRQVMDYMSLPSGNGFVHTFTVLNNVVILLRGPLAGLTYYFVICKGGHRNPLIINAD